LPTKQPQIIETYSSGTNWYRVWSDGWCEQGGANKTNIASNADITITFLKAFKDINYNIATATLRTSDTNSPADNKAVLVHNVSITGFHIKSTRFENKFGFYWQTCGYISTTNNQNMVIKY